MAVLGSGGICVVVALSEESAAVPLLPLVGVEQHVVGSCAFGYPQFAAALDAVVTGRVPAGDLISERVGLVDTPDALLRLRTPGQLVRVLTLPGA
jgi:threonine dehydrogenase-like Zn-dependent dehydrogenase